MSTAKLFPSGPLDPNTNAGKKLEKKTNDFSSFYISSNIFSVLKNCLPIIKTKIVTPINYKSFEDLSTVTKTVYIFVIIAKTSTFVTLIVTGIGIDKYFSLPWDCLCVNIG